MAAELPSWKGVNWICGPKCNHNYSTTGLAEMRANAAAVRKTPDDPDPSIGVSPDQDRPRLLDPPTPLTLSNGAALPLFVSVLH